ncbi:metalloregulator ArsR/SmtB family transcription factor [Oceanispirochaeta sp.]|jgi:DNA-binding transcriptional ArsR family regulator|uniref:ArsR/SmtB family transcription factor n=1 Tax=Oceanispirochaeta sp. TaxID=2035350 RepID=UPI002613866F|nr:metalloregulator ArsR/SmtB family transcription factor [Oceanispirochaeta sp.]MDA3955184.1 metalloregulator ArsR/SmtB family transcription factor [Oceanispirochaeta sp.]
MEDIEDPRITHDSARIEKVRELLVTREELDHLVQIFKIFGDPSRLKIINALIEDELCVHEIAELMEMSQPAVSHQLRQLKQAHVVNSRRAGKHIFYSLLDEHVIQIFRICQEHLSEG